MSRKQRNPQDPTRRDIFRMAACAAVGTAAMASTVWDLRMMNAAIAAGTTITDYKALVCLFLYGGNDANNLVVPYDATRYAQYLAARKNLAIPQAVLLPVTSAGGGSPDYSFHPRMTGVQSLFSAGKLAVIANVGTLVYPTTKTQYNAKTVPLPAQLFSHNDQQVQWQTSVADTNSRTGWGGRVSDKILEALDLNQNPQNAPKVSMSMTVSGTNTWEVGNNVHQYSVSTNGAVSLTNLSASRLQALKDLLAVDNVSSNLHERAFADANLRALAASDTLGVALSSIAPASSIQTVFPGTSLGNQLKMVARLIKARDFLNQKRQIFFCSIGGYDTHGSQLGAVNAADPNQPYTTGAHANLLGELSAGLKAFYDETVVQGIPEKITAFTASDFGRTFPTNDADVTKAGSDHGWGSHQMVVGGAVAGQKVYGNFPTLTVGGPSDTSTGRWIPSMAVDEYSATLARWFGISDSDLDSVFPNIGHFARRDVGFMG